MTRFTVMLAFVLVLAIVVVGAGAFLLAGSDESAGAESGATLGDVAERPHDFDERTVTISGEIAENDYLSLADAQVVLAIGDDAGEQLLVYPQEGVELPDLSEETVLRVTGTVRAVGGDAQASGGLLEPGGLLSETGAEAVIEATAIDLPTDERAALPDGEASRTTTVRRVLEDPAAWVDRPVLVPGTIAHVGKLGFVLAGDRRSIFVGAPASDVEGLQTGDQLRVRADVERLSRFRAGTVEFEGAPSGEGDPFLVLRAIVD